MRPMWKFAYAALERDWLPERLIRLAIRRLLSKRLVLEERGGVEQNRRHLRDVIERFRQSPIAIDTDKANDQHYEVPPEFFRLVLGRNLKYSSGYWPNGVDELGDAEEAMLSLYEERAEIADGQEILDLGCGWGSLSLWLAVRFPRARILAVSNSEPQRRHIEGEARRRGLENLSVTTADVNRFDTERRFDRILSIEMFEHMKNYALLMRKISRWLREDGKLFVHMFTHQRYAYSFESEADDDWMGRNFFTGGTMPSDDLLLYFQEDMVLEDHWTLSGRHYQKTAEAWLENIERNEGRVREIFASVYGLDEVTRWIVRWRVFLMACAELWGFEGGNEWTVSHYLFYPRARAAPPVAPEPSLELAV
jgi:cyclopropane-fatty-acyl-phospholipid synthase